MTHDIRDDLAFEIALEAADWDEIREWIRSVPWHALRRQWHIGDGDGGAILEEIRRYAQPPVRLSRARQPTKAPISQSLRTAVYERDEYRCVRCGTYKALSVDHIYPESKGGPTDLGNLQTLCRPCNTSKGAKVE